MPGQWTSIETNFPTFTGQEPVEERLSALYNYMYIMTEQLKYNLSNLGTENFNASALKQLTENASTGVAEIVAEELEKIAKQYAQINGTVKNLAGRMNSVENMEERVDLLEDALSEEGDIQNRLRTLEEDVPLLEKTVSGEGGLKERTQTLEDSVSGEGGLKERTQTLEDSVSGEGGLEARMKANEEAVAKICGAVDVQENAVTLGNEEKELRLIGRVYINGVLFQPEQSPEEEQIPEEEGTE